MKTIFETKEDKVNYLKGLIRISKCNGLVEPEEMEYFSLVAKGLELDSEIIENINSLWSSNEVINLAFSTRYIAAFFMQEALQLCIIDGSFDEAEQREIALIGAELGVSESDINRIHAWIMDGMAWKIRGEEMLSEIAKGE